MSLENKRIGFAMCGSFCTFKKAFKAAEDLVAQGANLLPIMSFNARKISSRFGTADENAGVLEDICHKKVISTIEEAEPIGPQKLLDVLVVAPCTGNTLAKLAMGITDTPVTMAVKSHIRNMRPVVIAISTNDALANSAKNIGMLMNYKNYYFVPYVQDDSKGKPNSLIAKYELIPETVLAALDGKQIQPLLY